jgi:hypothetical protein
MQSFFVCIFGMTAQIIEHPKVLLDISRKTAEPHDAGTKRNIARGLTAEPQESDAAG